MKEIEQRNENEILLRCHCGGDHFLSFSYFLVDKDYIEYSVSTVDPISLGLTERIWRAVRYVFKGDKIWWHDANLNSTDLRRIIKHMQQYIEETEKSL